MIKTAFSHIAPKLYRIRWRFTYSDGKPDVYGVWDEASDHPSNKASYQDKKNLSRAILEGEFVGGGIHRVFIDIPGHELKHVRCEAFARMSAVQVVDGNKHSLASSLHSMFFQTDYEMIGVSVNGQIFRHPVTPVNEFKSFEHSLGV